MSNAQLKINHDESLQWLKEHDARQAKDLLTASIAAIPLVILVTPFMWLGNASDVAWLAWTVSLIFSLFFALGAFINRQIKMRRARR